MRPAPPRSAAVAEATESTHISTTISSRVIEYLLLTDQIVRKLLQLTSLSDAELAEDQVQDVVGRCRPGDGIKRTERVVEVE